ncbi:MAG: alpha/beta fold hydrolase [Alphaproteobacteria bacterium]|nr:alpha/beta fold hydrolase [Alphaproteobacteria bacterium]
MAAPRRDSLAPLPSDERDAGRDLGALVVRAAAQVAWSSLHPRETFAERADGLPPDRVYYRAADGWEAPLWRYPPRPGANGEPLLLAHGLGVNRHSLDFREGHSLARAAWQRGFDVYLLEHRGDRHAVAPAGTGPFDFDDIVDHDLPAALAAIRERSGADRVLWVGHALGGQLLYGHLARGGGDDIAAGVALCAAVRFEVPASTARLASVAARLLPPGWRVPTRLMHRALAPLGATATLERLAPDTDGPQLRGLMLDGVDDVQLGLARQVARWVATGGLCDRHDRFDYVEALRSVDTPVMVLAADDDPLCPPAAARPAAEALDARTSIFEVLPAGLGHLDVIAGPRAAASVYPRVLDWLEQHRRECWRRRPWSAPAR